MRFLMAAVWGLIVLASLIGWGALLSRLLRPLRAMSPGVCGALGFSLSVFVGGVLGLFHQIKPNVVIGFVLVGLPLLYFRSFNRPRPPIDSVPRRGSRVLVAVMVSLLACRYLASIHQTDFEFQDDFPAYLVFPVKMLQTGSFAHDPFSDRRMNGLGGQQWSQCLVIAPFDPTVINLFDHGIALLLLLLICRDWLMSVGVERHFILLMLLTLVASYPNYVNTASFVTISALLLAIFVLLTEGIDTIGDAVALALLVSGICSLKTTVIPLVGCLLAAHFILRCIMHRHFRSLRVAAAIALLSLALLFPWMLSMHRSSGTFLAPLLGSGNSTLESLAGTMPKRNAIAMVWMSITCAEAGVLIVFCLMRNAVHRTWALQAALLPLVTAPVIFLISEMTGGLGWMRYSQPFIYGWIALPMTAIWIWSTTAGNARRLLGNAINILIAFIVIGQSFGWSRPANLHGRTISDLICGPARVIAGELSAIRDGIRWSPPVSAPSEASSQAMQAAIPPGAVVLERVNFPHLLDFKRNTIYLADHPGLAWPPPGLPATPSPPALCAFLLEHGVTHIAYSYGDEANYSHADAIPSRMTYAWDRSVAKHTFGFQDAVAELMKSHRVIYDDGMTAVIDLREERK